MEKFFDAAVNWGTGKVYFFKDDQFFQYDIAAGKADFRCPRSIDYWRLPFERIDAALNWGQGKVYFFSGGNFISYDIAADEPDPGPPQPGLTVRQSGRCHQLGAGSSLFFQ